MSKSKYICEVIADDYTSLQTVLYEALGKAGNALFIVDATDNTNRTVAEIRNNLKVCQ